MAEEGSCPDGFLDVLRTATKHLPRFETAASRMQLEALLLSALDLSV
jgi:hypothetical protein